MIIAQSIQRLVSVTQNTFCIFSENVPQYLQPHDAPVVATWLLNRVCMQNFVSVTQNTCCMCQKTFHSCYSCYSHTKHQWQPYDYCTEHATSRARGTEHVLHFPDAQCASTANQDLIEYAHTAWYPATLQAVREVVPRHLCGFCVCLYVYENIYI